MHCSPLHSTSSHELDFVLRETDIPHLLDCTLVVTRYVNQLRYEKRDVRHSRLLQRQSAYDAYHQHFATTPTSAGFKSPLGDAHSMDDLEERGLLQVEPKEFDPYDSFETKPNSSSVPKDVKAVDHDSKEDVSELTDRRVSDSLPIATAEKDTRTPSPPAPEYHKEDS